MTKKIRYAVVGGGEISQMAFMPGVGRTSNSEITALVTGDPEKGEALAKQYKLKAYAYGDYAALLASGEIDAVYIATPNFRHAEFAVPPLRAGVHVLLEKPMETSEQACRAILAAQQETGARLMVAYRLHFEPATVAMIALAQADTIGEPRSFTSTFSQNVNMENHRAKGGFWAGPVADMGPYPINAVRNLFGDEPVEVAAIGIRTPGRGFDYEDVVAVTLRFPRGRLAQFTVSYTGEGVNEFTLIGTEGSVQANPCYTYGPDVAIEYTVSVGGKKHSHKHGPVEQFGGETEYFSRCILEGCDPEPDGEEGLMDVRVICAIERALQTGERQALPPAHRHHRVLPDQALALRPAKPPAGIDITPVKA